MTERASTSAAKWLVAVMASVVLAFLVATFVSQYVEKAIVQRTDEIIANAMPSVQYLSAARGSLHELEREIERDAAGDRDPGLADRAKAERNDIEQSLAAYRALPFFSDEPAMYGDVAAALARFDTDRAVYETTRDPALLDDLRREVSTVDHALGRMTAFDAAQGERLGLEIERVHGESRSLLVILDGISGALALCGVLLALRQLRRAQRARNTQLREHQERETVLAEQNEALAQFAGRVAHDVLSPLSTAMMSLDMVRQACAADRAACRALDRGVASVHRVHTLVDGLLAFSAAGGRPEPGASTEVEPVLADVVDGLMLQAREQRIDLELAPVAAGAARCSQGVLTSVVTNLLRNAIKYMGDSAVRRIDLRATRLDDRWRFEVTDTGPGIPRDQQLRIFEPYVQLSRGGNGIGLGLATVDRLVRAHGGAVGVDSEPGHGARFWFELPIAHPVVTPVEPVEPVEPAATAG